VQLKRYQERVIREVRSFLDLLAREQQDDNRHATLDAWDRAKKLFALRGEYISRKNGLGEDLPTFCIKVPTGGGKTLLATQILGAIYQTMLKDRNGAGLVLWVVPSDQIYKDTLKALRDRRHFYRESLEFALSRRIEVWEKQEIARLTPAQLRSSLNILLMKLASTNREDREQLKFFRDSGGNIVQHFPAEDDSERHKALQESIPNLDMLEADTASGRFLAKTSLGNLARLCQPAVVLDEGHKATSRLARETIEGFNASIVVELSATPHQGANVLSRVSGKELLDEQMIKLPINIANSNQRSWRDCLTQAKDKREELARSAERYFHDSGRLIRPIVLVQVERTGKDQRDPKFVHSEDAKEYLASRLGVSESAIAIKTSDKDDIEGIDLLDEGCPIEWIITKAALQEGWDCPFAYVLVSLNNTRSQLSMTQLVGRVLRQPYVEKTPKAELNESYVFCLQRRSSDIANEVKAALEKEGYEGDAASVIDASDSGGRPEKSQVARIRKEFRTLYQPFKGKVYLPRFCVKTGKAYAALDYFEHLVSQVKIEHFAYADVGWDLTGELAAAKDSFYRLGLGQDHLETVDERALALLEDDEQVQAWIVASLPFDHFSFKQLRDITGKVIERLADRNKGLRGKLGLVKFRVRERLIAFIENQADAQTRAAFESLFAARRLGFYLECMEGRFEIPAEIQVRVTRRMVHDDNSPIQRSLFDLVPDEMNDYEKSVALFLDHHPQVLWWYRNLVGSQHFAIQGYRRNRIYPDFVVQQGEDAKPAATVIVVESKGQHLEGNPDTKYKRSIAEYFEKVGKKVPWQSLGRDFKDEQFRFQVLDEGDAKAKDWQDSLHQVLANYQV